MLFYALAYAGPPRVLLKPEPERSPKSPADVSSSENIFDRCYCIKSFGRLKTLEKRPGKVHLLFNLLHVYMYIHNGGQKHEGFVGFKNACSRAKTRQADVRSLNYVHFYARYCCNLHTHRPIPWNQPLPYTEGLLFMDFDNATLTSQKPC